MVLSLAKNLFLAHCGASALAYTVWPISLRIAGKITTANDKEKTP